MTPLVNQMIQMITNPENHNTSWAELVQAQKISNDQDRPYRIMSTDFLTIDFTTTNIMTTDFLATDFLTSDFLTTDFQQNIFQIFFNTFFWLFSINVCLCFCNHFSETQLGYSWSYNQLLSWSKISEVTFLHSFSSLVSFWKRRNSINTLKEKHPDKIEKEEAVQYNSINTI